MDDYIPDSEDDDDILLLPALISYQKMTRALQNIPENDRQLVCSELKHTRFSKLVPEATLMSTRDLNTSILPSSSFSADRDSEIVRHGNTGGDRPTLIEDSGTGVTNRKRFSRDELEEIRHDLERDDMELNLESNVNQTSRRGLRKRNFASTHPYIADQAHWLGLSSIESLNEMYRETSDLDVIVKLLNQLYMKKKTKYSSDEKYKAKSFYAFLGKKPDIVKDLVSSSQFTEDSIQRSFLEENSIGTELNEINLSNDSDLAESDSSILFLSRKNHSIIVEDDENVPNVNEQISQTHQSSTDEDSEDSDIIVRVGGKFRKERSVLRGTLPESAKRLDLYRSKKSKNNDRKRIDNEYRKGLAIKKSNNRNNRSTSLEHEKMTFVDDDVYYQETSEFYRKFDPLRSESGLILTKSDNPETNDNIDIFSDYSNYSNTSAYEASSLNMNFHDDPISLNENNEAMDLLEIQRDNRNNVERTREATQNEIYGNNIGLHPEDMNDGWDSAIEDNRIDLQFAYSAPSRNLNIRRNKRGGNTKRRNTNLALGQKCWKSNEVLGEAHYNTTRPTAGVHKRKYNRQAKNLKSRSNGFDEISFGELTKKRIGGITDKTKIRRKLPRKDQDKISINLNSKKSQKDLLITDYYFLRTPNTSTTVFEAESTNEFVKSKDANFSYNQRGILPSHLQYAQSDHKISTIEISNNFIFDKIDMNKIHSLKLGPNIIISNRDSFVITILGEKYTFLLVDKVTSNVNCEKLLFHLSKLLNDIKIYSNNQLKNELYQAIKGIIEWFLILQEEPSENSWTYLIQILDDLCKIRKKNNVHDKLVFFPYVLLLFYIFIQISQRGIFDKRNIELRYVDYDRYSVKYWTIYFQFIDIDRSNMSDHDGILRLSHESVHLMYFLFQNHDETWWPVINKALNRLVSSGLSTGNILDMLYFLASLIPTSKYNWSSFYIIYNAYELDDESTIHKKFIEIIYSLNERFLWPFEEKLITTIYSTVTARKFSNFNDERNEPELIDILATRDSIPNSSFFEQFMHLLYCYVSSLPFGGNKKRLISKLFTSSHYHYQKGSRSFAMFVNRYNFILLLSQLSDVDLRIQLVDLVQLIKSSNDIRLYDITIKGLQTYSEIATSKNNGIPFDSFYIMIERIIELYMILPGVKKLWKHLLKIMDRYILCTIHSTFTFNNHFMFFALARNLEFSKFTDEISVAFMNLLSKTIAGIKNAEQFKISDKNLELINAIQEKCFSFLHTQMGRFPFLNHLHEERTTKIIEESIKVWIRCNSFINGVNWNVLVLQKFPYIGNSYLRERFVLFFYNELLSFAKISSHIDSIILALLKSLALFSTSPYLSLILNLLMKSNHRLFIFKTEYFPEQLTSFQMSNFKLLIASNIIFNIAHDEKLSKSTKTIYLEELLKCLNEEYNKHFLSNGYVEYCKKLLETVQKHCAEFIQATDEFSSLARKLGIQQLELNEYRWLILPLKDKLVCLNNELSSAIYFRKDVSAPLDKYVSSESFDLVYHLISIYMKSIANNQHEKWIFVSLLMEYLCSKLKMHKVLISDKAFYKFLRLLIDLGYLRRKFRNRFTQTYETHQMQSFISAFAIFRDAYYLYDGYKDKILMQDTISEFIDSYNSYVDNSIIDLHNSFSTYVLFDIQQPGTEMRGTNIKNSTEDELNNVKEISDVGYDLLIRILRTPSSSELFSISLSLDISF